MNPKLIAIFVFSILYAFFEIYMGFRQSRKGNIVSSGDKGSIWLLYILITVGYILSFRIAATKTGRVSPWNLYFIIGTCMAIIGLIIRITSIITLKKHFTYTVAKVQDHELIETGLYKWIRHPGYLGQLIIFAGISMSLSNWLSVVLMMLPVLAGYLYRIRTEEKFMVGQFGVKYTDYQKRTKRLIPGIY
jgi:protein-S-isoprenylcysteine O-methyltransferase